MWYSNRTVQMQIWEIYILKFILAKLSSSIEEYKKKIRSHGRGPVPCLYFCAFVLFSIAHKTSTPFFVQMINVITSSRSYEKSFVPAAMILLCLNHYISTVEASVLFLVKLWMKPCLPESTLFFFTSLFLLCVLQRGMVPLFDELLKLKMNGISLSDIFRNLLNFWW